MKKIIILFCAIFCAVVLYAQESPLEEQLIKASYDGNLQTVQTLLSNPNVDINATYRGLTALANACLKGNLDIVKELLSHKNININKGETDRNKRTPLMLASIIGHADVVAELLKHSPKLNKRDKKGYTALMYAAYYGHMDVAQELLAQKNIKVNVFTNWNYDKWGNDIYGPTALLIAYNRGHRDIAMEILKVKPRREVKEIFAEMYQYYDAFNSQGNTLLLLAARDGDIEMVKYLFKIENDRPLLKKVNSPLVRANCMNNDGDTSLVLAARNGYLDIVLEILKQDSFTFDAMNSQGRRAYREAATQEIRDAIDNYKGPSQKTSETIKGKVLKSVEYFKKKINKK